MKNYKDLSDIELFIKVEKYDPYAIEELYLRYSPVLFPLIVRIVNDPQAAEDILIDVFISLWRKIDLFNFESGNTYTWLVSLSRNKAAAFVRWKHSASEIKKEDDDYENFYIIPDLDAKIESLDLVSAQKRKSAVEEAVNKLTEAQKYVLFLSYYDGFTLNEIANKLNIPLSTIRSKIMASLHSLKDHLLNTTTNLSENSDLSEMISAYAVGCMDEENYSYFKKHKQSGEYLPEGTLGELQATISLLPMTLADIKIAEDLKDRFGQKLLKTHKEIMSNIIADRRKQKLVEEISEVAQPVQTAALKEKKEEEPFVDYESDAKEEPESSRSKLFWFFNFMLIAALILFSYLLSDKTSLLNDKVDSLKVQVNKVRIETSTARDFITEHMKIIEFFNNPNIDLVQLTGGKKNPQSIGKLFLSFETGEGLLEIKSMPVLESSRFYSLWMIDKKKNVLLSSFKIVQNQKYIKISQIPNTHAKMKASFNITEETKVDAPKPSGKTILFGRINNL